MLSFSDLRAQAETLAAGLPPFEQLVGYRTTANVGAASRQRAGHGEDFWQYRGQTPDDSASAIDWRRSATGDELFVREHELQSARLLSLWADGSRGFDWKSDTVSLTKADAARAILTAIAVRYCETGDLAGVIEGVNGVSTSHHMVGPMLDDFLHLETNQPGLPRSDTSQIILASDFYGNIEDIFNWAERETMEGRTGILLQIIDPAERDFPYSGRVRFRVPGSALERVFGRTELLKTAYLERFTARQEALSEFCKRNGWQFILHCTEDPLPPTAYAVMAALHVEANR